MAMASWYSGNLSIGQPSSLVYRQPVHLATQQLGILATSLSGNPTTWFIDNFSAAYPSGQPSILVKWQPLYWATQQPGLLAASPSGNRATWCTSNLFSLETQHPCIQATSQFGNPVYWQRLFLTTKQPGTQTISPSGNLIYRQPIHRATQQPGVLYWQPLHLNSAVWYTGNLSILQPGAIWTVSVRCPAQSRQFPFWGWHPTEGVYLRLMINDNQTHRKEFFMYNLCNLYHAKLRTQWCFRLIKNNLFKSNNFNDFS